MKQEPTSSAIISPCSTFRYTLTRVWDPEKPRVIFLMLNPSTADHKEDDPTSRKCIGFARRHGYGGFTIINLWAYRTSKPKELRAAGYPVGPDNDRWILRTIAREDRPTIVCAWGKVRAGAVTWTRIIQVGELIESSGLDPTFLTLERNQDGSPSHPLMLSYESIPAVYEFPHKILKSVSTFKDGQWTPLKNPGRV